ncbi:MAG: cysteine desulfurase [Betaproteobacteria bacterium]|nr:cysteine desulfurase [Betaproteobacteria bacterium]MDH3435477.1 cysteine desulfurase [Betaproteobacteria bacterium]
MTAPHAAIKASRHVGLDVERLRADFPILRLRVNGKPLVFLDSAASSQMPQPVLDRWIRYQTTQHANIHRAVHYLSETATAEYEGARRKLQAFINAGDESEVIFTSGTTDAINLVAHGYGRKFIGAGDEIVLTTLEHHANIVPWQMVAEEKGARIRVVPVNDRGELLMEEYLKLLGPRTRLVGVTHVSNALGTVNPLREMIAAAHEKGIPVLVDGAQAVPHMKVDVQALDCDFYAFSGHKMFGPTGIGVLYGKAAWLEKMQPFKGGGDMILSVTFEKTVYNTIPFKFEAGTPPIAAAVTLGAAVDYLAGIDIADIQAHDTDILDYATREMNQIPGLRIIGTAEKKAGVISFTIDGVHPHDVGTLLNDEGVAVRTGHHCAQPVMQRFGIPATSRASFAFYNTLAEVDALVVGIRKVQKVFG